METDGIYSRSRRIFRLTSLVLRVHHAASAPLSSGTDYIDRFIEPALLHDPAGTSCPTSDLPNVRRIYVPAKNSRERWTYRHFRRVRAECLRLSC